jgi:molybdopterin synthase sulfur carrier subunit
MDVTLRFLGALRHSSGKEKLTMECEKDASIMSLVETLTSQTPALRRNLLDEHLETPKPNALIIINGREISVLNGLDTKVKDGDEIVFVPVVHGG